MTALFLLAAGVALAATLLAVTRRDAFHALLYLVVSFLAVALVYLLLGAPLAAALEVIVYAGAVLVLFLFVIMMFHLGPVSAGGERRLLPRGAWTGPVLLALPLAGETGYLLWMGGDWGLVAGPARETGPAAVGAALFGPYSVAVGLAAFLLLTALVGAFHLGREESEEGHDAR